jgi:hypothetical protein
MFLLLSSGVEVSRTYCPAAVSCLALGVQHPNLLNKCTAASVQQLVIALISLLLA